MQMSYMKLINIYKFVTIEELPSSLVPTVHKIVQYWLFPIL